MAVNEAEFYDAVRRRAALDSSEPAQEATAATLRTLGERLSDGEVDDIAPMLPDAIAAPMVEAADGGTAGFSYDEFIERVVERTGTNEVDAERRARAVGATLAEAIGDEERRNARSQLPPAFDRLFWATDYETFLDLVQREESIDSDDQASEAAIATLEVLGERLSPGQAADIAAYLPKAFAGALTSAGTPAADLSAEEFLDRIADRAGVESDVAADYARAVTAALAEAIPDDEYRDMLDQLPDQYAPVLGEIVDRDQGAR